MKRIIVALTAVSLLTGCGIFGGSRGPTTPTVGERIPVLASESDIEVDPALTILAVSGNNALTVTIGTY